jgi:hypothetical protein
MANVVDLRAPLGRRTHAGHDGGRLHPHPAARRGRHAPAGVTMPTRPTGHGWARQARSPWCCRGFVDPRGTAGTSSNCESLVGLGDGEDAVSERHNHRVGSSGCILKLVAVATPWTPGPMINRLTGFGPDEQLASGRSSGRAPRDVLVRARDCWSSPSVVGRQAVAALGPVNAPPPAAVGDMYL